MPEEPLAGQGVLVTRPSGQAGELCDAITRAGGVAVRFPVIEIRPRPAADIEREIAARDAPDVAVFVSRNAVAHGLRWAGTGRLAAIGPGTAQAIEAAGGSVSIRADDGYDSESLLASPAFSRVRGLRVRIVRGDGGRELLGNTLAGRGADVEYLAVYERRLPRYGEDEIERLRSRFLEGGIAVVTIMSIASLDNLLALLPGALHDRIAASPLVTPAARVLKELGTRFPGCRATLASGPGAGDMLRAIVEAANTGPPRTS